MSNETGHLNRRSFLKGIVALGAVAALPEGLLTSRCALAQPPVPFNPKTYKIYRNACPRNCYDTCSLKTWVKDGVITFVEGAPESTFTHGTPCVKGLSYPRRVYSPDRIKYPMAQDVRGSGNWRRISWEEAMQRIAAKMLEIKKKDGSMLGLALTKYSGKFGVLNYAVEGMMSSLGYTTRFAGTPCWPAGIDAQNYDMGDMWCNDPEDMVKVKYIIIWGANPAWCSMHSMKYIYQAREKGAKVVVIDPLLSQTAAKADLYLRVRPGSDGALALGMARHLVDKGLVDQDFVNNDAHGYPEFEAYLRNHVTVEWASEICGLSADVIRQLAEEFTVVKPATVWIGYGMQRHVNGGANVRAIDAFVAMSGNIGVEGGGARYGHLHTWGFNYNAMLQKPPEGAIGIPGAAGTTSEFGAAAGSDAVQYSDRSLNINQTAQGILEANDPPVRMLWVACKNPFAQDFDRSKMKKAFEKLEMVVCADQFFNETVQHADIVLPVTTAFEEWNVDASYWHYWLSINQPAIKPMYEAKCDLEIATMLSRAINKMAPGSLLSRKSSIISAGWIRSSTTVWRKCSASLPGTICWTGRKKRSCQALPPGMTASSKRRQASMNLNLNWRRKTATPRCRNTNRKPRANCRSICLRRTCSLVCTRSLSTWTGCRCSTRNRSFISILLPHRKKASARTIWSKFSMAPVKLSCGQKSPPTCRKIFW